MFIREELARIQLALKAPKGQFNNFGKYSYRNCEDILEAVKPLLSGCVLTVSDEMVLVGDRVYVQATARIAGGDGSGEISTTAFARESLEKKGMDASQITGAASSYARKYALNGLFLIDDNKDADSDNSTPNKDAEAATAKIKAHNKAVQDNYESIYAIKLAIAENRLESAVEAFSEISEDDKMNLRLASTKGGIFTTAETSVFTSNEWSEANKSYYGK